MEDPFDSLKDFVCDLDTDVTPWSRMAPVLPPWTEERHAAHRERMMGNKLNEGKHLSQETKDKISAANTGRKQTEQHIYDRVKKRMLPDHMVSGNTRRNRRYRERQREKLAQRPPEDAQ